MSKITWHSDTPDDPTALDWMKGREKAGPQACDGCPMPNMCKANRVCGLSWPNRGPDPFDATLPPERAS